MEFPIFGFSIFVYIRDINLMFEKRLEIGRNYIPLLDCPISIKCYDQEYFEGFRSHHLGVGLVIVDTFFLCESSSHLSGLKLLDGTICFSFDQIDPLSIDDPNSLWNIRFANLGEDLIFEKLLSLLDSGCCPFFRLWGCSGLLISGMVWVCSYCEYLWFPISGGSATSN